jgi:hypothetical protein
MQVKGFVGLSGSVPFLLLGILKIDYASHTC